MISDMTEGTPSKILLAFAMPMMLSGMFQQFYNVADSMIAGKFAGVNALAAVGASYPIIMLFIAVATGGSVGCSVIISQYFGAKEYTKMKSAISTAAISFLVLSIFLILLGLIICNPIMHLLNTPLDIFDDSALYLRIYILGMVFLFLYNIATAIFNGLGDSKTPLYLLIFSSLFNIVLDLLFVAVLHMGVAGVALATFIAQGISSVLALLFLRHRLKQVQTTTPYKYFDKSILKNMSKIAVPSILQQSIVSVGQLCVQALVNSFGSTVIAGYSAAIKIDSFFKMPIISMSNAISSFSAQNIGAKKLKRIDAGKRASLITMFCYAIASVVIILLFSRHLIGFFVDTASNKEVIAIGTDYMHVVSFFYFAFALLAINNGLMRGASYMKGFTIVTLADLIVRVAGSYLFSYFIGYHAIWWSIAAGWVLGAILGILFIMKSAWEPQESGLQEKQ